MSGRETTVELEAAQRPAASPTSGEEALRRRLLDVLLVPESGPGNPSPSPPPPPQRQ